MYKNLKNTPDHLRNKNKVVKEDLPNTIKFAPNNFSQNSTHLSKKPINNSTTLENCPKQQKIFNQETIS